MARALAKSGNGSRTAQASKYDAHNTVLSKTYGAFADLRRELSDSKAAVNEREELLNTFAICADSQRAWLLLEDYFERLSLSRKDFPSTDWWPKLLSAQNKSRLEELAFLFLRARRSLPTELSNYANLDRFAQVEGIKRQRGSSVGLGLGLYISRAIIVQHQGQIGVESTKGEGSTFWFALPLADPEDNSL